jgi:hypothetical protein
MEKRKNLHVIGLGLLRLILPSRNPSTHTSTEVNG